MIKKLTAAAMLLSMLLLLVSPAMAFSAGKATTTADWLNFRAAPDMSGRVIDMIPCGSEVEILEEQGDWCRISWNGVTGYVYSQYLHQELTQVAQEAETAQDALPEGVVFGIVRGDEVRFRKTASLTGEIYGYFYQGIIVKVLEESTQWTKIEYSDMVGYIASQFLRVGTPSSEELAAAADAHYLSVSRPAAVAAPAQTPAPVQTAAPAPVQTTAPTLTATAPAATVPAGPAPVEEKSGPTGDDIVAAAKSCLGVPYAYGGASMKGFDCSGLTYYVYAQNGITLSRTATAQYKQGTVISKSELQPGDLVFFSNEKSGGEIGHVGIYIGDGKLIHASSESHKKIVVADLYSYWFEKYYYDACRILK